MAGELVLTEVDQGVGIVTLNRPDRHNALDDALIADITGAIGSMTANPAVRVVVLSSVGFNFCAGVDLHWMNASLAKPPTENLAETKALAAMLRAIADCPKPTVARIHGGTFGAGIGIVAACDIALATFDTEFAFTETRRGLLPGVISPFILGAISARHARRYLLTGERFSASEAYRLGLVHEIVADHQALDMALADLIDALMQNGPVAMAECKSMLAITHNRPLTTELLDHLGQRTVRVRLGAEGREGITSFIEKRAPNWVRSGS